jgi:hypothetical protein
MRKGNIAGSKGFLEVPTNDRIAGVPCSNSLQNGPPNIYMGT